MIDVEKFKPDATGKYSPLLYKWLTSKKRVSFDFQHVFQSAHFLDKSKGFREHWSMNEIIIGHGDFDDDGTPCGIGGRKRGSIIRGERGSSACSFYWTRGHVFRDITDQFWAEYERIGRCAWDHSHTLHMVGAQTRWHYTVLGQRECNWCGHVQEELEGKWVDYKSSKPSEILHPMGSMGEEC